MTNNHTYYLASVIILFVSNVAHSADIGPREQAELNKRIHSRLLLQQASNPTTMPSFNLLGPKTECIICQEQQESIIVEPCHATSMVIHHACIGCIRGMTMNSLPEGQGNFRCPVCRSEYQGKNYLNLILTYPGVSSIAQSMPATTNMNSEDEYEKELLVFIVNEQMKEFKKECERAREAGRRAELQRLRHVGEKAMEPFTNAVNKICYIAVGLVLLKLPIKYTIKCFKNAWKRY